MDSTQVTAIEQTTARRGRARLERARLAPPQAAARAASHHPCHVLFRRTDMKGPYQRLLVPIDGSTTSQLGFNEALKLAQALDASMVLLHVIEYYPVMWDGSAALAWEKISEGLRKQGQGVLERAHAAARSAGVASEVVLEDSAAARVCDAIVHQARDQRCDLIVMGSHGRRGIEHALLGSDAERVARMSPVPLLLVRAAAKP
jgi:nucleotide-binding universal stress UspA family protein